jgi:CRISPR/Cas system endoribonuclease Cas6 (RAMP superfamily)
MADLVYQKFVKRWQEVTELPPQTVGPLTPLYKKVAGLLKVMPWPMLVFISILCVIALYILVGSTITFLVSVLQRGF